MNLDVRRVQIQRSVIVIQGAVVIAQFLSQQASVVIATRCLRVYLNRLVIVAQCASVVVTLVLQHASVDVISGPFAAQIDCLSQVVQSLFVVAQHAVYQSSCTPVRCIQVLVMHCLRERCQRSRRIVAVHQYHALLEMKRRCPWLFPQQEIDILQGSRIVLFLCAYIGTKQHVCLVVRREDQRLGEVFLCLVKLIGLPVHITAGVVRAGHERTVLYRRIAVLFRASQVTQLNLGYSTVQVRLSQIRLHLDDLIEILDTEHIILIIQRIPPNRSDTIGIQLRLRQQRTQAQQCHNYLLENFHRLHLSKTRTKLY